MRLALRRKLRTVYVPHRQMRNVMGGLGMVNVARWRVRENEGVVSCPALAYVTSPHIVFVSAQISNCTIYDLSGQQARHVPPLDPNNAACKMPHLIAKRGSAR